MLNSKWCLAIGLLAVAMFVTTAAARDVQQRGSFEVDAGAGSNGTILNQGGALPPEGDVVYWGANLSGYYFRPFPGYRDYDDIHLEAGPNGDLVKYSIVVFGSTVTGADAGSPFDVTTCLYEDVLGDPSIGIPAPAPIANSCCVFPQVPTGLSQLTCVPAADVGPIPQGLWLSFETTTDNSGWTIADFNDCPTTGPPGFSEDFWAEEDLIGGGLTFYYFGGCPANPNASFGGAQIVADGKPWACCDLATYACLNLLETECIDIGGIHVEGTLCNNLDPPCSEGGACCNTATGVCEDTFESLCTDYLAVFYPGQLCTGITCDVPPNVPTLTQWGMIALTVLLLTGLTIKFGRRRTVTA